MVVLPWHPNKANLEAEWGVGPMKACAAFFILLGLGLGCVSSANAQAPPQPMTIKIFNDDPDHYIFPVFTTGQHSKPDIWLQAQFGVTKKDINRLTYLTNKSYRIYMNSLSLRSDPKPPGIAPGQSVTLTLPLYTQLFQTTDATKVNQYSSWWNGARMEIYINDRAEPPLALTDALISRRSQAELGQVFSALPTLECSAPGGCQPLLFASDTADLPGYDPYQLLEFTLGAKNDRGKPDMSDLQPDDVVYKLDAANVDFDVSYVNIAYGTAALGPYQNDQIGYVGSPQKVGEFQSKFDNFLKTYPKWPRLTRDFPGGIPQAPTYIKLPSPLEIFSRLSGGNAPVDLYPLPPKWPTELWDPIQKLRTDWHDFSVGCFVNGRYAATNPNFCKALRDVRKLLADNWRNYKAIYKTKCDPTFTGDIPALTEDSLLEHIYKWTPFTAPPDPRHKSCGEDVNLLQKTPYVPGQPGAYSDNNFAAYRAIKLEFDQLNYDFFTDKLYVFNPWVKLIHGDDDLKVKNAYAYSVDDAVGNIQAYGKGIIIDIGDTKHLENKEPASAPITVALGGPKDLIHFTHYRLCQNVPAREKEINPDSAAFDISANNPQNCPVFLRDNKIVMGAPDDQHQYYTFKVVRPPPFLDTNDTNGKVFEADPPWSTVTAARIDCLGNTGTAPFYPSSREWCCLLLPGNSGQGVYAYTVPEVDNAHKAVNHKVITLPAKPLTTAANLPGTQICSQGVQISP